MAQASCDTAYNKALDPTASGGSTPKPLTGHEVNSPSDPVLAVRATPGNMWAQTWFPVTLLALAMGGGFVGLMDPGASKTFSVASLVISLLGIAALLVRASRSSLLCTNEGVSIQNFWKKYDVKWEEIEMIGWDEYIVGGPRLEFPTRCVTFWLRPGAIQSSWFEQAKAKVTSTQPIEDRRLIVETLHSFAELKGIPIRLTVDDLVFKPFSLQFQPTPRDPDPAPVSWRREKKGRRARNDRKPVN